MTMTNLGALPDEPATLEEALVRIAELTCERDAYKRAKAENDERFMVERDEARAEVRRLRLQFAEGRGHLVTCETHDAQEWWTLDGLCPHCLAEGKSGAALADRRGEVAR